MVFKIASSPYTHNHRSTNVIMRQVMLACIPGVAAQCYFFGWGNLIQILLAIVVAVLAESAVLLLRKKPVWKTLQDSTAALTGLLLGICIPPLAPWWIIVIGTLFAIIIAKQLYGGLGQNLFNPAMVGYVVLLISFPVQMTSWLPVLGLQSEPVSFMDCLNVIFTGHTGEGNTLHQLMLDIDGVTQATPLDTLKTSLKNGLTAHEIMQKPIFGSFAGLGWMWVNIGFLLGGLYLLYRKTIQWMIPVSFLLTLTIASTIGWLVAPDASGTPLFELFSGATMFGAFFIVTDPVTASTTFRGRLIFGAVVGLMVYLIRTLGGYPDGVAFGVLIANMAVPLIDHYTQPRVYGR
ncbi:electron transport complex subunit RsxD [Plesiomonas shigelloides]|uniref:Ion-translocating oxidoreductase complex subunit D n=1 Tax=Plesiomonas shigelloides TaxID=703 RepID=A0A8I1W6P0_PLESH|nr:electron transport complex subunit RsxD [Plesiomonas shigelloides]MBO1108225.1 electron transport complex subunit RsxD [Plesiomonas shigelloides]